MKINFTLNGTRRSVLAEPGENLQVLLQRMGIPSVRSSDDGEGFAGSDTILFDGKAVLAGLMVAGQAEGHAVETIESLSRDSRLSVLQESMIDAGVVQSAFNTPAAALLLEELLRRTEAPTEDDIRDALSGLFSRSTGYKQFFLAVELARKRRKDPGWSTAVAPSFRDGLRVIGKSRRKIDGVKLVAGMKAYVEDRVETGSCVLSMLRSPHAHAFIKSIDTTRAQALPGVVLVIDHRTCPDVAYGQAGQGFPEPSPYDYRMFSRTVRHMGDRVAAVVAEDAETARHALSLIKVEYDVIPPILSLEDAMAGKLTPVHADHLPEIVYQFGIGADAAHNLAASASGGTGNVEDGLRAADAVIERTYSTSRVQCTPLEPHVAYTRMDGDRLIVHASTQVPWHLRRILARVVGMPENRIRVIKERVGGGYGSKQDVLMEEVCAYATVRTGRPVLYKYTREEEFIAATTRHPFRVAVKMGAKKDGTLTAISMSADADTGAYGEHCLTVPMNACSKSLPLFRCPAMAWEVRAWYTNHVPSGAYQGYGAPQGSFALQMAAAELADKLGMDLVSFFSKNHVREGDVLEVLKSLGEGRAGAAAHVKSCGLDRALARGCQSIGWGHAAGSAGSADARASAPAPTAPGGQADPDVKTGKGVAIIQQGSGLPGARPGVRRREAAFRRDFPRVFRRRGPGHGAGHRAGQDRRGDSVLRAGNGCRDFGRHGHHAVRQGRVCLQRHVLQRQRFPQGGARLEGKADRGCGFPAQGTGGRTGPGVPGPGQRPFGRGELCRDRASLPGRRRAG